MTTATRSNRLGGLLTHQPGAPYQLLLLELAPGVLMTLHMYGQKRRGNNHYRTAYGEIPPGLWATYGDHSLEVVLGLLGDALELGLAQSDATLGGTTPVREFRQVVGSQGIMVRCYQHRHHLHLLYAAGSQPEQFERCLPRPALSHQQKTPPAMSGGVSLIFDKNLA